MSQFEDIEPSADFVKGFNDGYLIAKELPKLAGELSKQEMQSDRFKGISAGISQYGIDLDKSMYPSWMTSFEKDMENTVEPKQPSKDDYDLDLER